MQTTDNISPVGSSDTMDESRVALYNKIQKELKEINYCQNFDIDDDQLVIPVPGDQPANKLVRLGDTFPKSFAGKKFLEIGANKGFFSLLALQRGADKVVSIEPSLKHFNLISDIKEYYNLTNLEILQKKFDESVLKYGKFDYVFVASVYHYMYMDYYDHHKLFEMLAELTTDYIIFEDTTNLDDKYLYKHCENDGILDFMLSHYTTRSIMSAALTHFGEILSIPNPGIQTTRPIWIFKKTPRNYSLGERIYKTGGKKGAYRNEIFMTTGKDGKTACLKRSKHLQCFEAIPRFFQIEPEKLPLFVKLKDCWKEDKYYSQVMEFLDGYEVLGDRLWELPLQTKVKLISELFKHQIILLDYDLFYCDFSASNFMIKGDELKIIDYEGLLYIKHEGFVPRLLTTYGALTITELIIHAFYDKSWNRNKLQETFNISKPFDYSITKQDVDRGIDILQRNIRGIEPFILNIRKMFEDWNYLHDKELYYSLIGKINTLFLGSTATQFNFSSLSGSVEIQNV